MGAQKKTSKLDTEIQYDPEGLMRARLAYIHEAVLAAEAAAHAMGVNPDSLEYDPPAPVKNPTATPLRRPVASLRRQPAPLPRPDFTVGLPVHRGDA